jgi:type VI secretion system protein ImpH
VRLFRAIWPEREPVGYDSDPRAEVVRFRSSVSNVFAASEVVDAKAADAKGPGELTVNFLGIATPGIYGTLPRRYAEELRYQARNKNRAPMDFFDIFNHRLVSLFYRALEKSRLVLSYEGRSGSAFERALYSVLGLGTPGLRGRMPLDDRLLVARAGLLSMRPMPAIGLASVIRSIFAQPVEIEQFIPQRYEIEVDDQNRLGMLNSRLGEDLYVGSEITLVQSKFRVRLGPLRREAYERFLPDQPAFRTLMEVVRLAVGDAMDFELQLVLRAEDVTPLQLNAVGGSRLGWTSWLLTAPFEEPADDARFDPESARMERGPAAQAA